jgi:hypothetical protein
MRGARFISAIRARRLLVSADGFDDLKYICRHVLAGVGWYARLARWKFIGTLSRPLDYHLRKLIEPRSMVMIVHGDNGKLVGGTANGIKKLVDNDWFGTYDHFLDVFALGCETAAFFEQYRLSRRCTNFIGYEGKVRFFLGSAVAKSAAEEALRAIGRSLSESDVLDHTLVSKLTEDYTRVMKKLSQTPARPQDEIRLTLALLEAQIQDLRSYQGAQA